jgi:probable H4MPT-linked C1 transfer pathway protein
MTINTFIGWDVGGAHLKVASVDRSGMIINAIQFPSPLWLGMNYLDQAVDNASQYLPIEKVMHVMTMTAELADIFDDRNAGVAKLVSTFSQRFGNRIKIYAGQSGLLDSTSVANHAEEIASANWHATANYVGSLVGDGILVDIGSTTTDIIPFRSARSCQRGYTDQERLQFNELVYTGIIRTPVMAIVDRVPYKGEWQSLMAECFATMADIYRLTGELNEDDDMMTPPDGAGKTASASIKRLARMLGTDPGNRENLTKWQQAAFFIAEQQLQQISQALFRVLSDKTIADDAPLIGAGCGRFLVHKLAQRTSRPYIDFSELLDVDDNLRLAAASCAPAVSVAQIARGDF